MVKKEEIIDGKQKPKLKWWGWVLIAFIAFVILLLIIPTGGNATIPKAPDNISSLMSDFEHNKVMGKAESQSIANANLEKICDALEQKNIADKKNKYTKDDNTVGIVYKNGIQVMVTIRREDAINYEVGDIEIPTTRSSDIDNSLELLFNAMQYNGDIGKIITNIEKKGVNGKTINEDLDAKYSYTYSFPSDKYKYNAINVVRSVK